MNSKLPKGQVSDEIQDLMKKAADAWAKMLDAKTLARKVWQKGRPEMAKAGFYYMMEETFEILNRLTPNQMITVAINACGSEIQVSHI